jgi:hypothetical protein
MGAHMSCGYWVSNAPDDPDAHVCAKPAVCIAQPNAPHLYERGDPDMPYCPTHATARRLEHLMSTGWTVVWLD